MYLFFFFFVCCFLFYYCLCCKCNFMVKNIFFFTVCFVWMVVVSGNYSSVLNYFLVQEVCGFLFLVCSSYQVVFLLVKMGVSPFHFWVFMVCKDLDMILLSWFLSMQKLPYVLVYMVLSSSLFLFILFFGVMVCHFQYFFLSDMVSAVLVSSTESFNWVLGFYDLGMGFEMLLWYLFVFFLLTFGFSGGSMISWYLSLVFMSLPFGFVFLVKVFVLSGLVGYWGLFFMFVVMTMFVSYLCFFVWVMMMSVFFLLDYFFLFSRLLFFFWGCLML
uniref:NADH dehydrogenase subunit 2 n=1 Tax=Camallanus lacustris TaxID=378086 RepID=UPI0022FDA241|nr:NADH dehydrogenase subunit 2 [Camallanus lacustris]WAX01715.1 NADH dehydrogenase subunit 2 [Camallanus lacustris]